MKEIFTISFLLSLSLFISCRNKNINEGEVFKPREISENYKKFHFNKITYEGVEYLITERDNNNPHEGFGFMAYRGNKIEQKQDSIKAYLMTIAEMQKRIYAKLYNITEDEVNIEFDILLDQIIKTSGAGQATTSDSPDN